MVDAFPHAIWGLPLTIDTGILHVHNGRKKGKNAMKFNSGTEMYDYLCSGRDLYSKSLGVYAFEYNDAGAICFYILSREEFAETLKKSNETGEYWAGQLGWKGSNILDDSNYDEYRYVEEEEKRNLYLKPSLDFCDETYMVEDWMDTDEVTVDYILSETEDWS